MTDAEFALEIAQPLHRQSGDYGAHSQSWRETETASAMISHECFRSAMRPLIALVGQ